MTNQLPLFETALDSSPQFSGSTYKPEFDQSRLTGQMQRVFELMRDGQWRTLQEIRIESTGNDSEAAISARLRDFRKAQFGGHAVERRRRGESERGLFEYRVVTKGKR